MAEDYNRLRLVKDKNGKEALQVRSPYGEWLTCKNTDYRDDEEDIRQYRSILPNFRHALLKQMFNL